MLLYRDFASQQELDAQYDVEKAVPDFTVYARYYTDQSKLARHRLTCELDVPFGPTRDEYLDIFPAAQKRAPILIFLHGGYWRILSAKEFSFVAFGPVAAGATVISVNYALCPKVTIDEIVRQARAAVAWTWRNAEQFGGDRNRIFISGHSAGAQLTAMCALADWAGDYDLPRDTVKGGFGISGVYDLRPIRYTLMQPLVQLDDGCINRNSPQLLDLPRVPVPLLFSVGGDETAEFRRQTEDFIGYWRAAGNASDYLSQPGKNHFDAIYGFEDARSPLCRALFRLMNVDGNLRNPR